MITQKIGLIGCGNMGGAILSGALESGVLPKENAYVYDVSSAAMERAAQWGVNLAKDCVDLCQKSDIILLPGNPGQMPGCSERKGHRLYRGRHHCGTAPRNDLRHSPDPAHHAQHPGHGIRRRFRPVL